MSSQRNAINKLPARPTKFIFDSFRVDKKTNTIFFLYSFDNGLKFTETLSLGEAKINWQKNKDLINKTLFNLHLVLGVGYYKAYCPKNIIINSGSLNFVEAKFWNKLYTKGLGEFFYKNKINYHNLINFPFQNKKPTHQEINKYEFKDRCLCATGGGKDSCVAAERLRELGHDFSLLSLNDSDVQRETAKIIKAPRIIIKRKIDSRLIELNRLGAYNGHVPISATFAWLAVLSGILFDYRHLVFANEASASYGNIKYLGEEINHQYSKSLEFENDFRSYLKNSLNTNINYFSILRPLTELNIVKIFSHYPKYFSAFSSCNRNFSETRPIKTHWCNECAKCAFIFSQLSAFLPKKDLIKIFGENLFQKKSLLPLFQELWGEKRFKPFECVGTPEEVKAAMILALNQKDWDHDLIPNYFNKKIRPKIKSPGHLIHEALKYQARHNVPENFRPTLILGYGQEGHFVQNYLNKKYPNFKVDIADLNKPTTINKKINYFYGDNYLSVLNNYEVIIKTPGISDLLPEIQAAKNDGRVITTTTNIFLEKYSNQTIGVTGTKGKSTCASLIYEIFKLTGKDVKLVGNIGNDPLKYIEEKINTKQIFVYELSSHQLSSANYSPHIALMINIFPDHLPYHQGFANYFKAKANITKYQGPEDYLVFNHVYPALKKLSLSSKAKSIDYLNKCSLKLGQIYYDREKIIATSKIKLLGTHNEQNIMAAICIAKLYKIKNSTISQAIQNFKGLPHRLEFVSKHRGLSFYDDAISTTPESTIAALKVFKEKIGAIILGGEDRGYTFDKLASEIIKLKIKNIVLLPGSGQKIKLALDRCLKISSHKNNYRPNYLETSSLDSALKFIYQQTPENCVVLLSTASPSYNLFKNYIAKGLEFQKFVKKYSK